MTKNPRKVAAGHAHENAARPAIWGRVPELDNAWASDDGQIIIDWRVRTQFPNAGGYRRVTTGRNGQWPMTFVHRLVLAAHVGPCPDGHEVNHRNGIPSDNRLANLEYVTRSENIRHARDVLGVQGYFARGEENSNARLTRAQVRAIRKRAAAGHSQQVIAGQYGVTEKHVSNIVARRCWGWLPDRPERGWTPPPRHVPTPGGPMKKRGGYDCRSESSFFRVVALWLWLCAFLRRVGTRAARHPKPDNAGHARRTLTWRVTKLARNGDRGVARWPIVGPSDGKQADLTRKKAQNE